MKKILFALLACVVAFASCSKDDDDDYDFNMIEGSWGLVHSEGYENDDPDEPLEWNFNCNPLNPSSYNDARMDIVKIEGNKYYRVDYYWSEYSKKWVKDQEYTFTINGNKVIPDDEEGVNIKILDLTSTSMTLEVKEGSTYYVKAIFKKLN